MRITYIITQDEFAWYLSTSPHYFRKKWIGATNENSNLNPTYYAAPQVQLADRHPVSKICITFFISQYSDATTEAHQKDRLLLLSMDWSHPSWATRQWNQTPRNYIRSSLLSFLRYYSKITRTFYSRLSLNGHFYKTDTTVKRTPGDGPCLCLFPLFDSS